MRRDHAPHPWGPEALTTSPSAASTLLGRAAPASPAPSLPAARLQHAPTPALRHAVEPPGRCQAACPYLGLLGCQVGDGTKAHIAKEMHDSGYMTCRALDGAHSELLRTLRH